MYTILKVLEVDELLERSFYQEPCILSPCANKAGSKPEVLMSECLGDRLRVGCYLLTHTHMIRGHCAPGKKAEAFTLRKKDNGYLESVPDRLST